MLDRIDKEKLYLRLTGIFLSKIKSAEWRVGSQIPTEEDLCRAYNVSKITVRRAVENLAMEGYLEKLQGKGTFVRQGPVRAGLPMKTTLVENIFLPEDVHNIKLIEKKIIIQTDDEAARRMGPALDRDVFFLKRLKTKEGVPVLVNELFVPLRVCPALKGWEEREGSVFEFLKQKSDLKINRVVQNIEVGKSGSHAGLLNIRNGSACMLIHRTFYGSGDSSVAYSRTTARADRFSFDSEFSRLS